MIVRTARVALLASAVLRADAASPDLQRSAAVSVEDAAEREALEQAAKSLPCNSSCRVVSWTLLQEPGAPRYAVMGHVLDTSRNIRVYGERGAYRHLSGRDATRAFALGDRNGSESGESAREGLEGATDAQISVAGGWLTGLAEQYRVLGVLEGHFYDLTGEPSAAMRFYLQALGRREDVLRTDDMWRGWYPPCNMKHPRMFWCGRQGGTPMWLHQPQRKRRCACVLPGVPGRAPHPILPPLLRPFDDCYQAGDRYECRGKPPEQDEL